ncbi:MAG: class I SAM-dependent methyltransferase [Candidatus Sericytochromatia bacterium]
MNTGPELNTPAAWDAAFAQEWERRGGPAQTAFFAQITLAALPPAFLQLLRQHRLDLLDWGCALGDALPVLAQALPECALRGLDISPLAIAKARQRHPNWTFSDQPLASQAAPAVLYSSNCLEHFNDPVAVLRQELLPQTRDYVVLLLPYLELVLSEGHCLTIDDATFPAQLDGWGLIFRAVIATHALPQTHWKGQQLLLVYAHPGSRGLAQLVAAHRPQV